MPMSFRIDDIIHPPCFNAITRTEQNRTVARHVARVLDWINMIRFEDTLKWKSKWATSVFAKSVEIEQNGSR